MDKYGNLVYSDWFVFKNRMDIEQETNSARIRGMLFLVHECKEIYRAIAKWPNEYPNKKIIHGALVPLISRSFRHCLAALRIALSGYPDSAAVLIRTIWEIRIHLALIKKEPLEASLGFLLFEVDKKIKFTEERIQDAKIQNTSDETGDLEALKTERKERLSLIDQQHIAEEKVKKYKTINYREACRDLGLNDEYARYSLYSEIAHGKYFADDLFTNDEDESTKMVSIYPAKIGCLEAAQEALSLHSKNLHYGAAIIKDEDLAKKCLDIRDRMKNIWEMSKKEV